MVLVAILVWILKAVLFLVAGILVLLLAAAAIPVRAIVTSAEAQDGVIVRVVWLFGLVRVTVFDSRRPREQNDREAGERRGRGGKKRRARSIPDDVGAIGKRFLRLVEALRHAVEYSGMATVTVGLPDPADTGIVYGQIVPITVLIERYLGIVIRPAFRGAQFDFCGRVELAVVPLAIVPPTISFIVSIEGRRLIGSIRGVA